MTNGGNERDEKLLLIPSFGRDYVMREVTLGNGQKIILYERSEDADASS